MNYFAVTGNQNGTVAMGCPVTLTCEANQVRCAKAKKKQSIEMNKSNEP